MSNLVKKVKKGVLIALTAVLAVGSIGISNVKALEMPEIADPSLIQLRKTLIEEKKGYFSLEVPYSWKESINCVIIIL